jgi:hypothetical protein
MNRVTDLSTTSVILISSKHKLSPYSFSSNSALGRLPHGTAGGNDVLTCHKVRVFETKMLDADTKTK